MGGGLLIFLVFTILGKRIPPFSFIYKENFKFVVYFFFKYQSTKQKKKVLHRNWPNEKRNLEEKETKKKKIPMTY